MSDHTLMASDESHGQNGRIRMNWQMVAGWIVTALLAYGAVEARVRVLEDRYERIIYDIGEIKSDVKTLIRNQP